MKSKNYIKTGLLSLAALSLGACQYDPYDTDINPVHETMNLECSTPSIAINEDALTETALTFKWTEARTLPDDYSVTYKAELDVLGNNFGSKTVITSGIGFDYDYDEENGIYTASFTGEQLHNWYIERWKLPVNKSYTLEFRVLAQWRGGTEFEAPEVRKVTVEVTPVQVIIFDADEMSVDGTAIAAATEINKTLENGNVYAWKGTLTPGELRIPVMFDGVQYYIHNADGGSEITDGQPMEVVMDETATGWNIAEAGEYRIVINMADRTATVYSEATDLKPLVVDFYPNGADTNPLVSVEVSDLYAYGGGTGWGVKTLNLVQSLADPQVFIYDGSNNAIATLGGNIKFCISKSFTDSNGTSYNQNNAYCFTGPLTDDGKQQDSSVELDKVFYLNGGAAREVRNSYLKIPAGTNFIIFDLRNKTLIASKK